MKIVEPLLYLCIAAPLALGQSTPAAPSPSVQPHTPVPTIRARANLVVVDVVVSDKNRNPIKNLKREDFTLLENKTPQTIVSFEEHSPLSPSERAKIPPMPALPPGVFTNITPAPVNSAVNVLLLDALNTPVSDQVYVHKQFLEYLRSVPAGTSIAIFGLSTRLILLQGFTSDPKILLRAAEKQYGHASPLIDDPVGGGTTTDSISDLSTALGINAPAGVSAALASFDAQVAASMQDQRSRLTLDALNLLARYLAGIHGRKNLVWFSASFPIDIVTFMSDGTFNSPTVDLPSGQDEYRQTINLLARSQVAVYPIDARGLVTSPVFQAAGGAALRPTTPVNDRSATQLAADHSTMNQIAEDTGGRAFYNANDLTKALDEAVAEGSSYYTLTYSPANTEWKNDFRHIQVKLAEKGVQLAYRRGYYAIDPASRLSAVTPTPGSPAAHPEITTLRRAMIHGVPVSTEIRFKTRVLPAKGVDDQPADNNIYTQAALSEAKGSFRRFIVDFDTEGHDYAINPLPNGKFHLQAEFAALVYQPDGKLLDTVSTTLVADITDAERTRILYSGLPFRLQVSVPAKGDYSLRIGVHDLNSDKVGSLEVPIASVANLPPVEVPFKPANSGLHTREPAK